MITEEERQILKWIAPRPAGIEKTRLFEWGFSEKTCNRLVSRGLLDFPPRASKRSYMITARGRKALESNR